MQDLAIQQKGSFLDQALQSKPIVRLDDHVKNRDSIIASFVYSRLGCLWLKFDADIVDELGRQILAKADGNLLLKVETTHVLTSVYGFFYG